MWEKSVEEINENDLNALIEEGVTEAKTLEFKRDLPGGGEKQKKEFLYDISSLANTDGGFLLYGIAETDGRATDICGVDADDPVSSTTALEQAARHGIQPPIFGLCSAVVELSGERSVVAFRVPKSWNAPHQVIYQNAFRIYRRDTNAKYQPQVEELREMFSFGSLVLDRVKEFRSTRLAAVVHGEVPVSFEAGARMVIHILPFSAFASQQLLDMERLKGSPGLVSHLTGSDQNDFRWNIDGFMAHELGRYAQLFRNGCIEVVHTYSNQLSESFGMPWLRASEIEAKIFAAISAARRLFEHLVVVPPAAICVTLLNARDWTIGEANIARYSRGNSFDRETIIVPDVVMTSFEETGQKEKSEIMGMIWNAAGMLRPS